MINGVILKKMVSTPITRNL